MTPQQLKNEIEERFEKKFRNPANLKEGIFWGWSSQDMNGYEQIKSFLLSETEKAYQAGKKEALEEVEEEIEKQKRRYTEENRYQDGKDMWGDSYANKIKQDISQYNQALIAIIRFIQSAKIYEK